MKSIKFLSLMVMPVLLLALAIPSANALSTIGQTLSVGSSGPDVIALQTYLAADATLYPQGLVTGYFGPLTQAAVIRFQARYGIEQVGRVGPITLAKLNALISGGATFDEYAPVMSAINASVGSTTATVTWKTNENARARVMYSTAYPFLYASAASSADANMDLDQSVTLSGLARNTRYYYVLESVDASGNIMWTTAFNFTTQ